VIKGAAALLNQRAAKLNPHLMSADRCKMSPLFNLLLYSRLRVRTCGRHRMSAMFLVAVVSLHIGAATATPFVPASDSTPLERLASKPGDNARATQSSRSVRALLARDPKNVDLAVRIAQIYIARARSESDPRLLGQAQAALGAWWSMTEPPVPVLLLRATILQSNHDFSRARRDLEQAVTRNPNNAQAWLTLATVQQVTGDLKAAANSCDRLIPLTPKIVSVTCKAAIDGASGQAAAAYDALSSLTSATSPSGAIANGRGGAAAVRSWSLTLQAELAERLKRSDDAERLYRASLATDPDDSYTIAAYGDFLIDAGRAAEVLTLIPATTRADTLLLRRAIASRLTSAPDAEQIAVDLTRRFSASRERGDRAHLREEARFALEIKKSSVEALRLAQENWSVQKEPLDARIVLEAAVAAQQPRAAAEVLSWLDKTKLQGEKLSALAGQLKRL
jgi:Tfp pilus assembly protein PilF